MSNDNCVQSASLNYVSVQPGSTSGLYLVLHVNQNDYLYARSSSAGFRVNWKLVSYDLPYFPNSQFCKLLQSSSRLI